MGTGEIGGLGMSKSQSQRDFRAVSHPVASQQFVPEVKDMQSRDAECSNPFPSENTTQVYSLQLEIDSLSMDNKKLTADNLRLVRDRIDAIRTCQELRDRITDLLSIQSGMEGQITNMSKLRCQDYKRLVQIVQQENGKKAVGQDELLKRIGDELTAQNNVLLRRALPDDLAELLRICGNVKIPASKATAEAALSYIYSEKKVLSKQLNCEKEKNILLNKELIEFGSEYEHFRRSKVQDEYLIKELESCVNDARTTSDELRLEILSMSQDSINLTFGQVISDREKQLAELTSTYRDQLKSIIDPFLSQTELLMLLSKIRNEVNQSGSLDNYLANTLKKPSPNVTMETASTKSRSITSSLENSTLIGDAKESKDQSHPFSMLRYSGLDAGGDMSDEFATPQDLNLTEKPIKRQHTLLIEMDLSQSSGLVIVKKDNPTSPWSFDTYEKVEGDMEKISTATQRLNEYFEICKNKKGKTITKMVKEEVNKKGSFLRILAQMLQNTSPDHSLSHKQDGFEIESSMIFEDEFVHSRLVRNEHLDEDLLMDFTTLLDAPKSMSKEENLQWKTTVDELQEKNSELNQRIEELKKKEQKLIKTLSKENITKEYESRIKDLVKEIERLKAELKKAKKMATKVEEYTPKDKLSVAQISLEEPSTVSAKYLNDFVQKVSTNTKLNWWTKSLYVLKHNPEILKNARRKGKYFMFSTYIDSKPHFVYALTFDNTLKAKLQIGDGFKKIAEHMVVDIYYGSVFSALVYYNEFTGEGSVKIVYPTATNILNVKHKPKTYIFGADKSTKQINFGSILHGNSKNQVFFITDTFEIAVISAGSQKQKKLTKPSLDAKFLATAALPGKPQMIYIEKDLLYVAMIDGSLQCYNSIDGKRISQCLENKDVITTMCVAHDTIMLGTTKEIKKGSDTEIAIWAMKTTASGSISRLVHSVAADYFISSQILKLTIQGKQKLVLVAVPRTFGGTLCFFDFTDTKVLWIADKEDWWPKRRINGLCQVDNSLLVYGESKEQDENRADLKTIACIEFN